MPLFMYKRGDIVKLKLPVIGMQGGGLAKGAPQRITEEDLICEVLSYYDHAYRLHALYRNYEFDCVDSYFEKLK